ncbi:MAG: DsbA family protein [Deltaproteobacteria bacterium]|nr:DsbA family protein [Deltaproteobacteria bacterium]
MTLISKLRGAAIEALLGTPGDRALAAVADMRRRVAREPARLDFYYDPADPASHLAAQVTQRLIAAYSVDVELHIVTPPASDVDPSPELRALFAVKDAKDVATQVDLEFVGKSTPDPNAVRRAAAILCKPRPLTERLALAIEVGNALFQNDSKAITALGGKHGSESTLEVPAIMNTNYSLLRKRGHYQAASWYWNGVWYGGIDRVPYLEAALAASTGQAAPPVIHTRPEAERPPARLTLPKDTTTPVLDFWFSFRSPYSYLALGRVAELAKRYPIEVRLRPILPMVTRGLAVPTVKRLYIVRDAKREADRLGVPFGAVCDPLGKGVENALAIAHHALRGPHGWDFVTAAARGAWSEARDLADYADLRAIVESAGMTWDEARAAIADEAWRPWAQQNASDLTSVGLWGVPSFRIGDYITWGQDRIDYLEDRLRRHFAAPAATVPST